MGYVSQRSAQRGLAAYNAFGQKASAAVLARVQMLPASQREKNLKIVLNKIDPSLWNRSQTIAKRYQQQGMPQPVALQHGIARAMSTGLASEVVKLGQRGTRRVPRKGLLGLSAYGPRSALGDASKLSASTILSNVGTVALQSAPPPTDGQCDISGQYIWRRGGWTRRQVTDVCTSTYTGAPITQGGSQGGVTVTDTSSGAVQATQTGGVAPAGTLQMMQVGPFTVPLGAELTIHWSGLLPDDWIAFIAEELTHDCQNCVISSMENATPGHPMGALRDFLGAATPTSVNKDLVSIGPKVNVIKTTSTGGIVATGNVYNWPDQPLAQVKRPDNGEVWGFYLNIVPKNLALPWDSSTNPYVAVIGWRKAPTGVWDFIKNLVGTVIDWVGDALSEIGDLACQLLTSPVGQVGATAAGAAIGASSGGPKGAQVGATVGAAGAQVGAAACGTSQVCPAGTVGTYPNCIPLSTTPSWLLPVAIGGGALLLVLAVTGKKKPKKASSAP